MLGVKSRRVGSFNFTYTLDVLYNSYRSKDVGKPLFGQRVSMSDSLFSPPIYRRVLHPSRLSYPTGLFWSTPSTRKDVPFKMFLY